MKNIFLFAVGGLLAVLPARGQQDSPPMRLGINFPFRGHEKAPLATYLNLLHQSGAPAMRYLLFADVYWKSVEPGNDAWNFTYPDSSIRNPYGILSIPMLYANFGVIDTVGFQVPWRACSGSGCGWQTARDSGDAKDYVQTVVARYKDVVKYWELGNEITMKRPKGLPASELTAFMHMNHRWLREADSSAHLLYPALPGTYGLPLANPRNQLRQFLSAGGAGAFDILSYHDYNAWWTLPAHYDSLKALLAAFNLDTIPIWCTESSISSDPTTPITPAYSSIDEQAADVWRRPAVLFAKGVQVYFWHSMWSSGGNNNWREFGILSATGKKKKSFYAFKLLVEKLEHFSTATALSFGNVTDDNTQGGNGVWVVQFDWPDGTRRWVAWSPDNQSFTLTNLNAPHVKTTAVVPVSISADGETAAFDVQNLTVTNGTLPLPLSNTPILIEEDFATGVADQQEPPSFELAQNHPNPFHGRTTICFSLPQAVHVTLTVLDAAGREMTRPVDQVLSPGTHTVELSAERWPDGIYFYQMVAGPFMQIRKAVVSSTASGPNNR